MKIKRIAFIPSPAASPAGISRETKLAGLVISLLLCAGYANCDEGNLRSYAAKLLAQHNSIRAENKLAPLKQNARLAKAAQAHADHMAATGKAGHEGIGDGTIPSRIDDAGYQWTEVGENIAWGLGEEGSAAAAMKIWRMSELHRKTLLSDYQEVGFGRAVGRDGKIFWVACFGTPQP